MAITPTQAQQLTREQVARIDQEEQRIDAALRGFSPTEARLVPMPNGFTDRMYNELKGRYTAVGWNVIKGKMEVCEDRPGASPHQIDAWRFSIASASGCSAYDYYNGR